MMCLPVHVVLNIGEVPPGCCVRAYLVFRDPSLKEPVQRCAKHQSEEKCASGSEFHTHVTKHVRVVTVLSKQVFLCCLVGMLSCLLVCCHVCHTTVDSPISEHWVRGHPDCCPIYGVANGVHYVDIPYDKLMGRQWTDVCIALHAFWCTCLSLPHCPSQGTQKISGLCTIFSATARAWSVQAVNGREGLRLPHAFLP